MAGIGTIARAGEARALTVKPPMRSIFRDLHGGVRTNPLRLPEGLGRPLVLVSADIHGSAKEAARAWLSLPVFPRYIDCGDKLDRGEDPLSVNQLLHLLVVQRLLGNHDAMWVGAGLGIERLAIELVRWLMRYNEIAFLANEMKIDLTPLQVYAGKYFGDMRGHYKANPEKIPVEERKGLSEEMLQLLKPMEAAATYLKIIAEAQYRFPEHRNTVLNESERKVRSALFHGDKYNQLTVGEKDTFNRLTGKAKLDERDSEYFYRLMGGFKEFTEEEQKIIDHFRSAFQENHAYYQLIECMVGNCEIYTTLRMAEGAPYDMLFTHAGIPITSEGQLQEYNGLKGKEAFDALERDFKRAMGAWQWYIETGDREFLGQDAKIIDKLGELPWGEDSPLYMRQMQTAARAVLEEESDLYKEPEGAFFTHWVESTDSQFVHRVCREIGSSFGLDPRRLVVVHGHKPDKEEGLFKVGAGGHDLNIDAGAAKSYGGKGGFLLIGTNALYQFALHDHSFRRVEMNLEYFPK